MCGPGVTKEEGQAKSTGMVKEGGRVGRGQGLALDRGDCDNHGDHGIGGEHDHSTQRLEDVLRDLLEGVHLKGILEEVHLQEDKARSGEHEKEKPRLRSTTIATALTPSKTMEHFSDPILLPKASAQQAKVNGLNPVVLRVAEEGVLGLERT